MNNRVPGKVVDVRRNLEDINAKMDELSGLCNQLEGRVRGACFRIKDDAMVKVESARKNVDSVYFDVTNSSIKLNETTKEILKKYW